jgi:tRNA pseudouridine55 synthase
VGTLDPFASGVLPIAMGEARKFIRFIEEAEKEYIFTMVFGKTTDTLDKTGTITQVCDHIPEKNEVLGVLHEFVGEIYQVPPVFSAIKVDGRRACDRVRFGESVQLQPRKVKIFNIKIMDGDLPENELCLDVVCSKGTYIRSLARDIAAKLETLAYVKTLRRTKSGFFLINNAIPLEKLLEIKDTTDLVDILTSLESPLDDIPALYLGSEGIARLRNGVRFCVENPAITSLNVRILSDVRGTFHGIGFIADDGVVTAVRMCVSE